MNRLAHEKSPYLQQHAHNPVDWYPWGEEAFALAKSRNKPVFLSIGYSTCHWCHVMAHESFEDEEIASLMNAAFVNIKVDREERPDIDSVYMSVCQRLTGSGGWPLTLLLTPDKKPFFAGTYFPKDNRHGQIGMRHLITNIDSLWKNKQADLIKSADEIMDALKEQATDDSGWQGEISLLQKGYEQLQETYDDSFGGFGRAPKFPMPHNLIFLLRYWRRFQEDKAWVMVEKTLRQMRHGGIFDHLGYGFHRYATDQTWLTPHFEKMLYDQALLAIAYMEAIANTGRRQKRYSPMSCATSSQPRAASMRLKMRIVKEWKGSFTCGRRKKFYTCWTKTMPICLSKYLKSLKTEIIMTRPRAGKRAATSCTPGNLLRNGPIFWK
jgi:uncharacterized protein YyaL (SSP411 family)